MPINATGILGNRRFLLAAALMLAFVVVVVAGRVVFARSEQANAIISNAASVLCAATASAFFVGVWISTSGKDASKKIWAQIAFGLVLWTIAEATWAYYEVILGQEVPYPSPADWFYLVGYIGLYLALLTRYRTFQITPTQRQKLVIALLVIVFSLIGGAVVLGPIIGGFDPQRILESLLNIAYPLLDLILLILALVIIFSLEQGRFAFTWRVVGLGLVFMSGADLLFSYASWNEIYNSGGQLNGITLLVDSLYYVSYLTLGLGAYTYRLTSEPLQAVKINLVLQSLTKSNILVFIDRQGKIVSLSDNFLNLAGTDGRDAKDRYAKMPLSDALGINGLIVSTLIEKTLQQGSLSTQPLKVHDANGQAKDVWLTSFAIYGEQGEFVSVAVVLRTDFAAQAGQERPLTEDQRMLINFYLTKAGTYRSEENQVLKTYFLEQVSLLYSLIQQFSGRTAADRLLPHLSQVARQKDWQFTFEGRNIGIPAEYEGQTLAERLAALLQEAKNFAATATNLNVVEHELRVLDKNLGADTLQYVDRYNLRSVAKPAFQAG